MSHKALFVGGWVYPLDFCLEGCCVSNALMPGIGSPKTHKRLTLGLVLSGSPIDTHQCAGNTATQIAG